jgi:hypothetical protein
MSMVWKSVMSIMSSMSKCQSKWLNIIMNESKIFNGKILINS